jgi:hypothetical protein
MKVYVLMESRFGGDMEVAGVFASRGAAGEAVLDVMEELKGCSADPAFKVLPFEVVGVNMQTIWESQS